MRNLNRFPWLTAGVLVLTLVVFVGQPVWGSEIVLAPAAVAAGEWWRIYTGQFSHFGQGHLWPNLACVALWGALLEMQDRGLLALDLGIGMAVLGILLCLICPELAEYRGLSGVAALLLTQLLLLALTHPRGAWWVKGLVAVGALLTLVVAISATSRGAPLIAQLSPGIVVVHSAHWVGALVGVALWGLRGRGEDPSLSDVGVPR